MRIQPVRHVVADRAVLHALFKILVEVLEDELAQRLNRLALILRQRCQILLHRLRFALHEQSVPARMPYPSLSNSALGTQLLMMILIARTFCAWVSVSSST